MKTQQNPFQNKVAGLSLFWILPLFVALLFQLNYGNRAETTSFIFLQYLVYIPIIHLFISLFTTTRFFTLIKLFMYSIFLLSLGIESIYLVWFGSTFSPSSLFILLETNLAEALEFLSFYTRWNVLVFVFIIIFFWVLALFRHKSIPLLFSTFQKKYLGLSLFVCLLFIKYSTLINFNFTYLFGRGVVVYNYERFQLKNLAIDQPEGNFTKVYLEDKAQPKTYVVVIGESTQRHHLQLYGYERETTPNFSRIQDELFVFNDVISTNVYTIGALKTALALNDFLEETESTLVQLMNQAGFKTFWISNQRPVGPYESLVTKMAKASTNFIFTNAEIAGAKTPYDEVLIPHFETALADKAKHKFIVVHLLGTHMKYENRYPEEYTYFTEPREAALDKDAANFINQYDNAIRYQDHVLSRMLGQLKNQNEEAYLLYFSDHGEEVFTTMDFAGHNEDNPTQVMYEIPFVLWHSAPEEEWINYENRRYSTRHLIHSIAELSKVSFEEWEASKSIFSSSYQDTPRIISKDKNYDDWINN